MFRRFYGIDQGLGCKGVDVDSPSDAGSPLIWAAGHDHPKAVKVLLESGANVKLSRSHK